MKKESGSIVLYVVIAMLFFIAFLVTAFVTSSNREISQFQTTERVKEIYSEDVNDVENIYQNIKSNEEEVRHVYTYVDNVPIPNGFYYVGGKKNTGIVISDNKLDENKGDSHAIAKLLVGNQFVWVPCSKSELTFTDWKVQAGVFTDYIEDTTSEKHLALQTSLEKYNGFYIGRYEASYGGGNSNETYIPLEKHSKTATVAEWENSNGRLWNWVNSISAKNASINMYKNSNSSVISFLPYTSQIDRILKWFIETGAATEADVKTDSANVGNFINSSFTHSLGEKTDGDRVYLNSGDVEKTRLNNIYDLAGNNWEWNDGKFVPANGIVVRSGSYGNFGYDWGLGSRHHLIEEKTYQNVGFRVSLYIK